MDTFEDLKQKIKESLDGTSADLEEAIKSLPRLKELKEAKERTYLLMCKFKAGYLIQVSKDEYCLISGEPKIEKDNLKIPIRHHIYPRMEGTKGCSLNMSGVVDLLRVPLNKIDDCHIISIPEYFSLNLKQLKIDKEDTIRRIGYELTDCRQRIENTNKRIAELVEELDKIKKFSIDDKIIEYADAYSTSYNFLKNITLTTNYWETEDNMKLSHQWRIDFDSIKETEKSEQQNAIKSFAELAEEQGIKPESMDSKLGEEFQEYMEDAVRKSRQESHKAEEEAKKLYLG